MQGKYQFELTVKDNAGATAKDTVQITANPPYDPMGLVQFWTRVDIYGAINIKINNDIQSLTVSYAGERTDCASGNNQGRFTLRPGTYSWKAWYGNDSTSGNIIIDRGTCMLQEISF